MNFELTLEQQLVRESVRVFAEIEILPLVNHLDKEELFSVNLINRMESLGNNPAEYGGVGKAWIP